MTRFESANEALAAEHLLSGAGFSFEVLVGILVLGGMVLIAMVVGLSRLVALLPMRRERRQFFERGLPVFGALLVLPYVLFAARIALQNSGPISVVATLGIATASLAAGWPAIRDVVAGVLIKSGRVCSVGDRIAVNGLEGSVVEMGLRTITLETNLGDEALLPYAVLARSTIVRTPAVEGIAPHVFRLQTPASASVSDARAAVLEAAMCSHWASVVRQPEVKSIGKNGYEVTVFALNPDHGMDVENAVLSVTGFSRVAETTEPQQGS